MVDRYCESQRKKEIALPSIFIATDAPLPKNKGNQTSNNNEGAIRNNGKKWAFKNGITEQCSIADTFIQMRSLLVAGICHFYLRIAQNPDFCDKKVQYFNISRQKALAILTRPSIYSQGFTHKARDLLTRTLIACKLS